MRQAHGVWHAPDVMRVLLCEMNQRRRGEVPKATIVPERSGVVVAKSAGGLLGRSVNPPEIGIELREGAAFVVSVRDGGMGIGIALDEAPALQVVDGASGDELQPIRGLIAASATILADNILVSFRPRRRLLARCFRGGSSPLPDDEPPPLEASGSPSNSAR